MPISDKLDTKQQTKCLIKSMKAVFDAEFYRDAFNRYMAIHVRVDSRSDNINYFGHFALLFRLSMVT